MSWTGKNISSLAVNAAALIISLVQAVVLARILGASGYGIYSHVFALVSMMVIPFQFGLVNLVIRETAKHQALGNWSLIHGVWHWSGLCVISLSALYAIAAGSWIALAGAEPASAFPTTLAYGLLLPPLIGIANLYGARLRGLRCVIQGRLPSEIIRPGLFVAILALIPLLGPSPIGADQTMLLHAIAAGITLLTAAFMARRATPAPMLEQRTRQFEGSYWLRCAVPMTMAAGVQILLSNSSLLLLGWLSSAEDVGIYNVSLKGAMLVLFGLQATNMIFMPYFARLHAQNETGKLAALIKQSGRITLLIAFPAASMFIFFGADFLRIVFGHEFIEGATPLAILSAGQLLGAYGGTIAAALAMTGREKNVATCVGLSLASNIVLGLVLIPEFGMNGAAIASALALLIYSVTMHIMKPGIVTQTPS